jgi:hypothetical protein
MMNIRANYSRKVVEIAPASGSQFALLPPTTPPAIHESRTAYSGQDRAED